MQSNETSYEISVGCKMFITTGCNQYIPCEYEPRLHYHGNIHYRRQMSLQNASRALHCSTQFVASKILASTNTGIIGGIRHVSINRIKTQITNRPKNNLGKTEANRPKMLNRVFFDLMN